VWDLTTGECRRTFTDANLYVERVHFLAGGRVLSAAACDYLLAEPHTSTVCVWDPAQPKHTPTWSRTFPGRATTVAHSPAAALYAVANKDKQVWLVKAPPEMK
jgi:WD40 repeat protein